MKVSGIWSLAGLVVIGWIVADLIGNGAKTGGTAAAFKGVTGLVSTTGNQVTGA